MMTDLLAALGIITAAGIWALRVEIRRGQRRWDRQNPSVTRRPDGPDEAFETLPTLDRPAPASPRAPGPRP